MMRWAPRRIVVSTNRGTTPTLRSLSAEKVHFMSKCDQSRIEAARVLVLKWLEEYGYADSVIMTILGVSESTFRRLVVGRYLKRRPSKSEHFGDAMIAKDLAVRVLVMGDYSVAEIIAAIDASQADVYRRVKRIHEQLKLVPEEKRAWVARWISRHWLSEWEPLPVREYRERKRRECWKRAKRVGN